MKIFIMRHGQAANIAGEDSLRPLTREGMLETEKMGLWLAGCKAVLMNVFVSPYLRAQQTGENVTNVLMKAALLKSNTCKTLDFITPSGNARQVHDFVDGLLKNEGFASDTNQAILFVSHMPFVSYLVAELTGTVNVPIFSTASVAIIEYDIELMQGNLVDIISPSNV